MLMSYMGCIGYIMAGSGLKDLFSVIYAENSVEKMLTGHAYARAVRAHILSHLALANIVFQSVDFTEEDRAAMEELLNDFDRTVILTAAEQNFYKMVADKFKKKLKELENYGPTAKLWVQYFRMVTLIKQFIEAERMGNWQLHLDTIRKMLPFFHASGHFYYAKSSHLYLQDMLNLKEKIVLAKFEAFTTKGYFTFRRSDNFWLGIWPDMTIEQTLMRTMKSIGGLTHGRGITDSVLTKWTLGMVFLHNVSDEIERFCGISLETTEQHVDMRSSRIIRDNQDVGKLMNWFAEYHPFPISDDTMSLNTGIVGGEHINCHMSQEVGIIGISSIIGKDFHSVKFKRKDRVIPLAAVNTSIRIEEVEIPIDPLLIFHRMCIAKKSEEELQQYLQFELSPYPLSLFCERGMRKGTKSSLYKIVKPCPNEIGVGSSIHVIDGGFLLHRVVWHRNESFAAICTNYIQYVKRHYGSNSIIIFDGYPADPAKKNTKSAERLLRSQAQASADVLFDESMIATFTQARFLANEKNKSRFISMLKKRFEESNYTVQQAAEDADTLIVRTAISMSSSFQSVFIVEDSDLLVLLIALEKAHPNVHFLKPGKGKTEEKIYSQQSLHIPTIVADNILFLHAFSSCDTMSAIFGQGRNKFLKVFQNSEDLHHVVKVFQDESADSDTIAAAGEQFLTTLYGAHQKNISLDVLRYQHFIRSATRNKFNLASLPPTAAAARQHSLRTYHQVQTWIGNYKNPEEWGWKRSKTGLTPVRTTKDPAPEVLLKSISCKCKKGCSLTCGCRKAGLNCSVICIYCNGQACINAATILSDSEEEEENEMEEVINTLSTYEDHKEEDSEDDDDTQLNATEADKQTCSIQSINTKESI